nr:MAG TPA: hypothetical protein [Caudoviricetes sp.]
MCYSIRRVRWYRVLFYYLFFYLYRKFVVFVVKPLYSLIL